MRKLLLIAAIAATLPILSSAQAFQLGDTTSFVITPKSAAEQAARQLKGITEPYEFEIGKCQSMFAESMYKKYMAAFKSRHAKRAVIKGVFGETVIKNHIASTMNAAIPEVGGDCFMNVTMTFRQAGEVCIGSIQFNVGITQFKEQEFHSKRAGIENFCLRYALKVQREWLIVLIDNQSGVYENMSKQKQSVMNEISAKLRENAKITAKIEALEDKFETNLIDIKELQHEETRLMNLMLDQKRFMSSMRTQYDKLTAPQP